MMNSLLHNFAATMKTTLTVMGVITAALLALAPRAAAQAASPIPGAAKPNVVVILADDLGYGDLGVHGCRDIATPHIDQLASESVRCTNGYASAPSCSPTRVGILTGRYSQRIGWEFNPVRPKDGGSGMGLPVDQKTIADRLKAGGYATGIFGKWHQGEEEPFHPLNRGFDEFYGFLWGGHDYFTADDPEKGPIWRQRDRVQLEGKYLTDTIADEARAFMERRKDGPFFAYVSFNAPHTPMQAPKELIEKFAEIEDVNRRTYAAMVTSLDHAVGRIMATLKELKLEENTLVFFLSDNGGAVTRFSVNYASNSPLRGNKGDLFEGGIRVPFFVRWTGKLKPRAYEQPVVSLDILPTSLAAASVEIDPAWKLDGVNLLPYLQGTAPAGETPHDAIYFRFGEQMAIRSGEWKLVKPALGPGEYEDVAKKPMLFNVARDMRERTDLADAHPATVRALQAKWEKWNAEMPPLKWRETIGGKPVNVK